MNFKEWYNQPEIRNSHEINDSFFAWKACKNQVLAILQTHTVEHPGPHGTGFEELSIDCIEEIKKL